MEMLPVGDFNIENLGENEYKLVLFLNINEESWQGVDDPAVYMYKYGMSRGKWIEKESAIELITDYDGVRLTIVYLRKYKGMESGMIKLMEEVLEEEVDKNYILV